MLFLWDTSFHIFHFLSKREINQKNNIHTSDVLMLNFKICSLEQKFFWWTKITSLQNDVMAKNRTILRLPCQTEPNPKLYFLIKKLIQIRFMWCLEYPSTDLKCITLIQCAPLGTGLLILKYDLALNAVNDRFDFCQLYTHTCMIIEIWTPWSVVVFFKA